MRPVCASAANAVNSLSRRFFKADDDVPAFTLEWNERVASIMRVAGGQSELVAAVEVEKLRKEDFVNRNGAGRSSYWLRSFKKLFQLGSKSAFKIVQVLEWGRAFLLVVSFGDGSGFGFLRAERESFGMADIVPFSGEAIQFAVTADEQMLAIASDEFVYEISKASSKWQKSNLKLKPGKIFKNEFISNSHELLQLNTGKRFFIKGAADSCFSLNNCLYLYGAGRMTEINLESGLQRNCFLFSESSMIFALLNDSVIIEFRPTEKSLQLHHFSVFPCLQVDWFATSPLGDAISVAFESIAAVQFGSAEAFILDGFGAVWALEIESKLRDPIPISYCTQEELEFAHIFNILGPFPLPSPQFYWQRRREMCDGRLCFDEALAESVPQNMKMAPERFPPADWPALSQYCRDLFKEARSVGEAASLIYYLLLCAGETQSRRDIFCREFGLASRQVIKMQVYWYIDHQEPEKAAVLIIQNHALYRPSRSILQKLIQSSQGKDFWELAVFAPGNLLSLDDFLQDGELLRLVFSESLRLSRMRDLLDAIKVMFAKMKPSDEAALIPIPTLHLQVLQCLLEALLQVRDEAAFLARSMELAELPFETEIIDHFMKHLHEGKENCVDVVNGARISVLLKLLEQRKSSSCFDESISLSSVSTHMLPDSAGNQPITSADPLARFFQRSATPSKSQILSTTASPRPDASPIRFTIPQVRPDSPLQLPRHFPPKQPTRLSQPVEEHPPLVESISESKKIKRRAESIVIDDDEEESVMAPIFTKEHAPVVSRQTTPIIAPKRRRRM